MIDKEYNIACSETLAILNNINKSDVIKIPNSFINFLKSKASSNYEPKFDFTVPLNQLSINQKTKELLGFIYITWWCSNDEKEKYKLLINDNKLNKQQLYNSVDLFAKSKKNNYSKNNIEETSIIKYEPISKIKCIIRKILKILKIKK